MSRKSKFSNFPGPRLARYHLTHTIIDEREQMRLTDPINFDPNLKVQDVVSKTLPNMNLKYPFVAAAVDLSAFLMDKVNQIQFQKPNG